MSREQTKKFKGKKPNQRSNTSQKVAKPEVAEDSKEERKFVPWLGEARPKRGPIYDFESKIGTQLTLSFLSGRTIQGTLISCDRSTNLVLENTIELLDQENTRKLGKVFTCGRIEAVAPST